MTNRDDLLDNPTPELTELLNRKHPLCVKDDLDAEDIEELGQINRRLTELGIMGGENTCEIREEKSMTPRMITFAVQDVYAPPVKPTMYVSLVTNDTLMEAYHDFRKENQDKLVAIVWSAEITAKEFSEFIDRNLQV